MFAVSHVSVLPRVACAVALLVLGCAREAHLTRPLAMTPVPDATLTVELERVLVSPSVTISGLTENDLFTVVLAVTNAGREPYLLNAASISCWLELSPDQPGETRSFAPKSGGEGAPGSTSALGSTVIPPGEARRFWVRFQTYRYPGSDVPRKITIFLPDARGRRVQLVIADPARGQRWDVEPPPLGAIYGLQQTFLSSSELHATGLAAQFGLLGRVGPFLWDLGTSTRWLLQRQGPLVSETSSLSGVGLTPHLAVPFVRWGLPQLPLVLGVYGGGEAQLLNEIPRSGSEGRRTYGALSAEGGVELDLGGRPPAQSPFPISFSRAPLPSATLRAGYAHWWVGGNDVSASSGGFTFTVRLTF